MGQTYCAGMCGGEEAAREGMRMLANEMNHEPNPEFAKKVKQHIELHPRIKFTYLQERTPHPPEKKGVQLQLFYLYPFSAYYEGCWKYGLPNGFGRVIYDDGSLYQGCFNNGVAECCRALFIKSDGSFYKGSIKNNKASGYGELSAFKLCYKGNWKDDLPHGKAVETYSNISFYDGEFVNGVKEGFGTYQWNLAEHYMGTFHMNKIDGNGELRSKQYTYIGSFKNGVKDGQGKYIDNYSKYIFQGTFQNNEPKGQGVISYKDGTKFIGIFDGFLKRKGILLFLTGQRIQINTQDEQASSSIDIIRESYIKHQQAQTQVKT